MSTPKRDLFNATKQAFVLEGYSIAESDYEAGVISTARRQLDLDERHCDCGTTMGLPYIRDKRTITAVSFGAVVGEGRLTLRANIEGEYLRGVDVNQSIAFDCVSRGLLESQMYDRINAGIPR